MLTAPTITFQAVVLGVSLTDRQSEILGFIAMFQAAHHYPPTIRQIVQARGYRSPAPVQDHLVNLECLGVIERSGGQARSLRIVKPVQLRGMVMNYRVRFGFRGYLAQDGGLCDRTSACLFGSDAEAVEAAQSIDIETFTVESVEQELEDAAPVLEPTEAW